ncbi:MAG: hemerythrin domain-containing protein [Candidatus Parabeggiatoa sp. nov. 2]|nr:MAG: hemerythrin HHE cation-binding protein [Beggiatoa sp. 4572_84]RKZ64092.1 MAG: hemerythrin domain-containing protein [Gammaproteobacteria bacterium]HEC84987.1 hemerythrin domain-containing protein [Thioploca sp.]
METITQTLSHEHSRCDKLFAQSEESVAKTQWARAATEFADFKAAMERHFTMEEQVLFPTVEERTGQTMGPTQVMRMEHQQMRQVFADMQDSLTQQDSEQYLGLSETVLMLMQQHNAKEEQMLYPMSDQVLSDDVPSILNQMRTQGDSV